jgi:DNA-binding response OmpR family regulator
MASEHESMPPAEVRKVLIMDDRKDCADSLAIILRHHGHDVLVAYSAEAALKIAATQRPDVFLLDLGMPDMDGFTVAVKLRHELSFKDALIVAVTGFGIAGDRARTAAAGYDLHLTKPIDGNKLVELLGGESPPNHW